MDNGAAGGSYFVAGRVRVVVAEEGVVLQDGQRQMIYLLWHVSI